MDTVEGKARRAREVGRRLSRSLWERWCGESSLTVSRTPVADVLDETRLPLARGGNGGRGNLRFANAVNQVPLLAEAGDGGEEAELLCELKLLADVGIIGKPNAGKSTMISTCSAAKPRVASYPFTTLSPVLGMVARRHDEFLLVEIPGLIEGAHKGVGLGHDFLRHVARTRLLWHLVDGVTGDVAEQWNMINQELGMFSHELLEKPQLLVVNKADAMTKDRRRDIEGTLGDLGVPFHLVSAMTGEGVEPLIKQTISLIKEMPKPVAAETNGPVIHRPKPKYTRPEVWLENGDLHGGLAPSDASAGYGKYEGQAGCATAVAGVQTDRRGVGVGAGGRAGGRHGANGED